MNKRCYKFLTTNLGKKEDCLGRNCRREGGRFYPSGPSRGQQPAFPLQRCYVFSATPPHLASPSFLALIAKPSYAPPWHGFCPASLRPRGTRRQHTSYRKGQYMPMLGGLIILKINMGGPWPSLAPKELHQWLP
jgi:hypothetical protein